VPQVIGDMLVSIIDSVLFTQVAFLSYNSPVDRICHSYNTFSESLVARYQEDRLFRS